MTRYAHPDTGEEFSFSAGDRYLGASIDGPWFKKGTLGYDLIEVFAWLSWVAHGCPMFRVAAVDYENGTVTLVTLEEEP